MTKNEAKLVAEGFGGEAWQSEGGVWLVMITTGNDELVVISEDVVCRYPSEAAFLDDAKPIASIHLH